MTTEPKKLAVVAVFLLAVGSAANAKTIYVDADRPPGGSGTNWTDAYKYLQDALADANTSAKPVEIRVAQGTYYPDEGAGVTDGDREATFGLINGVTLRGGYAGDGEPDPNDRDIDSYGTILSGDLDGNDVQVGASELLNHPTRADNSHHIITGDGTDETAVLDGFTVTAGHDPGTFGQGAGVLAQSSSLTITNCTIKDNSTRGRGGGGSIYGAATIDNCIFSANATDGSGGGVFADVATLTNCTFSENYSRVYGGGIFFQVEESSINATLNNCTFKGNSAQRGGALVPAVFAEPILTNCSFVGNSAQIDGGAIWVFLWSGYGMTLTNCVFSGNLAGDEGGAYSTSHDDTKLFNCTFSENHAGGDGGAYCVSLNGGTMAFNNCIFWGNTASGEGPQIAIKAADATLSFDYSDVQGGELDIYVSAGTLCYDANNIESDPLFVDPDGADDTVGTEDDNLRLLADSNCIDAGDNTAVPADTTDLDGDANTAEPVPYDLDGNPRFIDDLCTTDTGNGTAPVVDMGAYEFLRSDITSDGDVNFKDLAQFALYWWDVTCGACGGADLTCDGDVDWNDVRELADNWLW